MAVKTKKTNTPWFPGENSDKVLVAKVGQEKEFMQALQNANHIAAGSLGWDGHAEIMWEIGGFELLGIAMKKSKYRKVNINRVKKFLQHSYLSTIAAHSEWLTPEEAEKRHKAVTTLYGKQDSV